MAGAESILGADVPMRLADRRSGVCTSRAQHRGGALRSPGIQWILARTFAEGCRNSACEAIAIAYRYDDVLIDTALRETVSWGRVHLPGYGEREIIDVVKSNYRRSRPHGLSSCRLLALVDHEGSQMRPLAAVASCAATGGPPPRRRKRLVDRRNRPLVEELSRAIACICDGRLCGRVADRQAAAACGIPIAQFAKHVKPILRDLAIALPSRRGTVYGLNPNTYRRLSRPNLIRLMSRDAKVPPHRVLLRIRTLHRHLLTALFSLCDQLRGLLRPTLFAIAGSPEAAVGVQEFCGCAIEGRPPPRGER